MAWVLAVARCDGLEVQEFMAGFAHSSLHYWDTSHLVAVPADHRYVWDLAEPEHRQFVKLVRARIESCAPRSTPWSVSAGRADPVRLGANRAAEKPTLDWVSTRASAAAHEGRVCGLENQQCSACVCSPRCTRPTRALEARSWTGCGSLSPLR